MTVIAFVPRHLRNATLIDASTLDLSLSEAPDTDVTRLIAASLSAVQILGEIARATTALESELDVSGARVARLAQGIHEAATRTAALLEDASLQASSKQSCRH